MSGMFSLKSKTVHVLYKQEDEPDWLRGTTPLEQM